MLASSPTFLTGTCRHLINVTRSSAAQATLFFSTTRRMDHLTSLTVGHKVDEFPSQHLTREPLAFDSGTSMLGEDDLCDSQLRGSRFMQGISSDVEGRLPTGELSLCTIFTISILLAFFAFPTFHELFGSEEPQISLAFLRPLVQSFCLSSSQGSKLPVSPGKIAPLFQIAPRGCSDNSPSDKKTLDLFHGSQSLEPCYCRNISVDHGPTFVPSGFLGPSRVSPLYE